MKCPKCGYENSASATVCSSCYFDLKGSAKPVSAPPVKNSTRVAAPPPVPVATAAGQPDLGQQGGPGPVAPGFTPPGAGPMGGAYPGPEFSQNTSGMGNSAAIPAGVGGWNWGAFLLSWIWAIGNSTWIGLLALLPYVGWIMAFVLGAKGSEWAWQSKRWESVEQFKATQKKWAIAGLIFFLLSFVLSVAIMIPVFLNAKQAAMQGGMQP